MKVLSLTAALLALVAVIECGIILTGNADTDFSPSNPSFKANEVGAIGSFKSTPTYNIKPTSYMGSLGRVDGFDVDFIRTFYDTNTDILYVGIQCKGVCGDTDGNLNPNTLDENIRKPFGGDEGFPTFSDDINGCNTETYTVLWWNNVPKDYDINKESIWLPTFLTGDSVADCIFTAADQKFLAYEFPNYKTVNWALYKSNPDDQRITDQINIVAQAPTIGYTGARMNVAHRELPKLELFANIPSAASPHLEFILRNFSKYPGNEYLTPGRGYFRTGVSGSFYATADPPFGEDFVNPQIWEFSYDCESVPGGKKVYDFCGVCGGDNSTCKDCFGVPNGVAEYDECGICGGDGTFCKCDHYLGMDLGSVDYALLRWSVDASLSKINDTLAVLKSIRSSLHDYDYENGDVALNSYIDIIHEFCDECLNDFDDAQLWFTEILSGACDGLECDNPFDEQTARWSL